MRFWIRLAFMGVSQQHLSASSTTALRRGVLLLIALDTGPGFQQRAIHREVLIRKQLLRSGLRDDLSEEHTRNIPVEQPLPILAECGGIPDRVVHVQPYEPTKQQVVVELFHQPSFARHRIEHLQEQGTQ